MNDEMRELGRRAIAAGFVWVPGARTTSGQRVVCVRPNESPIACYEDNGYTIHLAGGQTPDFSDPATVGCLLAQVRGRWGTSYAYVEARQWDAWLVWVLPPAPDVFSVGSAKTEAGALVSALERIAALEAAPKVAP